MVFVAARTLVARTAPDLREPDESDQPTAAELRLVLEQLPYSVSEGGRRARGRHFWIILAVVAAAQIAWVAWQQLPETRLRVPLIVTIEPEVLQNQAEAAVPEAAAFATTWS